MWHKRKVQWSEKHTVIQWHPHCLCLWPSSGPLACLCLIQIPDIVRVLGRSPTMQAFYFRVRTFTRQNVLCTCFATFICTLRTTLPRGYFYFIDERTRAQRVRWEPWPQTQLIKSETAIQFNSYSGLSCSKNILLISFLEKGEGEDQNKKNRDWQRYK